jgi:hypothetical protein
MNNVKPFIIAGNSMFAITFWHLKLPYSDYPLDKIHPKIKNNPCLQVKRYYRTVIYV